jgi:hypothetical protein
MDASGNSLKAGLFTGIIAGVLDLAGVLALYFITTGRLPVNLVQYYKNVFAYIASAAFDNTGTNREIWGLVFHFMIAITFSLLYFSVYPRMKLLQKNIVLSAVLYGLFVWVVMNMIVVPLSALDTPFIPKDFVPAARQAVVLIICIGFPLAIGAQSFYNKNKPGL